MGDCKPVAAMVIAQTIYASVVLLLKAAFNHGMSPMVFVVYRHIAASIALAPLAYTIHSRSKKNVVTVQTNRSFALLFLAALIGVTINQNFYNMGLHLGSSTLASAMSNLSPAITFLMSASLGMEKVDIRSPRSIAKILGTAVCVAGAGSMAFFKGDKLLIHLASARKDWLMACLSLLGNNCCWSLWLILQVPLSGMFPEPMVASFWMCLLACFQSGILTLFLERDPDAWRFRSNFELFSCIYAGIVGSGTTYYLQSWCVAKRGPLFSAMFNPLCTVITAMLAFLLTHEDLYVGSLLGAAAVVIGLYVVLWGKAEESPSGHGGDSPPISDVEEPLLTSSSGR